MSNRTTEIQTTNSIYFWKIIFTYMIVLFHYPPAMGFLYNRGYRPGWYIAVEFFFIVSGYLLYDNLSRYRTRYETSCAYTIHRLQYIWPRYLFAFIIVFSVKGIINKYTIRECIGTLVDAMPEIFLLQGIGLNREWNYVNPTLWYLSILLIGGYIIYWFLLHKERTFVTLLAPVLVMIGYSYLYRYVGSLDAVTKTEGFYENQALIRGFCDMCMGIFAVKLRYWLEKHVKNIVVLKLCGSVLMLLVILGSLISGASTNDFSFVMLLVPAIAIGFIPYEKNKISDVIEKIAGYTLDIYLIHEVFRMYLMWMIFPEVSYEHANIKETIVYILLVTATAIVMDLLARRLETVKKDK